MYSETTSNWDPTKTEGKHFQYPSPSQLATAPESFGSISLSHSFIKEPSFENVTLLLLKSSFLSLKDLSALVKASPLILLLWTSLVDLQFLDFSPLRVAAASLQELPSLSGSQVKMFLACALHYNFDMASVIRYIGGNYTAAHTDIDAIVDKLQSINFDNEIIQHIYRSRTIGCPAHFKAESTHKNFMAFLTYGNHSSISKHLGTVLKTLVKEVNKQYVIPFPRWIARFCPNLHLTPQGILLKAGKNPRQIWDGSFLPEWWCSSINSMQSPEFSPDIVFGTALLRHLTRIYNLRISYPNEDILVWDDDVSGAYRWPKYHPGIAAAFAFAVMHWLFIPTGGTFGSTTSPHEYESFARARAFLAEHLSRDETLVLKHSNILHLVKFASSPPSDPVVFVQATVDFINQGVIDPTTGLSIETPHNPFVDDTLMADVRRHILTAMAASLEALFLLLGYPCEFRRSPLSMDKFYQAQCSWEKEQLGLIINTRTMTISLPQAKVDRLLTLLKSTWHQYRKTFTLMEGTVLLVFLEHAAQICPWGRYLYGALRHSVTLCLKQVLHTVKTRKNIQAMLQEARDAPSADTQALLQRFLDRKIAKDVYASKHQFFITRELRSEIEYLRYILLHPHIHPWTGHIGHIVPRTPTFHTFGDSSLYAAGVYSLELKCWWYLEWPPEIQNKTLKAFTILVRDHATDELISINLLEFATAIINYAAATACCERDPTLLPPTNPYPVLLNHSDNESTNSWLRKTAYHSSKHRALSRILCSLRMDNPIGLNASYISTSDNFIADYISRLKNLVFGPSDIPVIQRFPQLASCQIFHLSQELYSSLIEGLLQGAEVGISRPKTLGHFTAGSHTT